MFQSKSTMEIVTGKPVSLGGSQGRREATGRGVALVTRELLHKMDQPLSETTIAIQGYGNVGSAAATILHGMGCQVTAVSDISGGIMRPGGLDIPAINEHTAAHPQHLLEGYAAPGVAHISNQELLTCDVDVLIPAALENQIHAGNADQILAHVIVEAANGPTTSEADKVLHERGITVVPDILANAGGVVVSYFEWVQDLQCFFWTEDEVNRQLERIMVQSFERIWSLCRTQGVSMRQAAYMFAVNQVASAIHMRGIFP
jgi:glutamate dehydrogenase (NAD(P)+)